MEHKPNETIPAQVSHYNGEARENEHCVFRVAIFVWITQTENDWIHCTRWFVCDLYQPFSAILWLIQFAIFSACSFFFFFCIISFRFFFSLSLLLLAIIESLRESLTRYSIVNSCTQKLCQPVDGNRQRKMKNALIICWVVQQRIWRRGRPTQRQKMKQNENPPQRLRSVKYHGERRRKESAICKINMMWDYI